MGDVSIDPCLYTEPSPQLLDLIRTIDNPSEEIRRVLSEPGVKLTPADLDWVRKHISKEVKGKLYTVLRSCELVLPAPVFPERNPLLEERCRKLRIRQEDQEYRQMTRNIRESKIEEKPLSLQFKELNGILIMLVQFAVSVAASFLFGYLAPYYLWGRAEVGPRLLSGTLAAFFVGLADLYFVIREHLSDDGIRLAKKID